MKLEVTEQCLEELESSLKELLLQPADVIKSRTRAEILQRVQDRIQQSLRAVAEDSVEREYYDKATDTLASDTLVFDPFEDTSFSLSDLGGWVSAWVWVDDPDFLDEGEWEEEIDESGPGPGYHVLKRPGGGYSIMLNGEQVESADNMAQVVAFLSDKKKEPKEDDV